MAAAILETLAARADIRKHNSTTTLHSSIKFLSALVLDLSISCTCLNIDICKSLRNSWFAFLLFEITEAAN